MPPSNLQAALEALLFSSERLAGPRGIREGATLEGHQRYQVCGAKGPNHGILDSGAPSGTRRITGIGNGVSASRLRSA